MNYILAFLAGVFVILSLIINSELGKFVGIKESAFINYFVGFICILSFFILTNREFNLLQVNTPTVAYFGGAIGVLVVIITNIIIPKISAVYTTILLFAGQIFGGIIIDFLINNIFSIGKIIGSIIIFIGVFLNIYFDNKKLKQSKKIA